LDFLASGWHFGRRCADLIGDPAAVMPAGQNVESSSGQHVWAFCHADTPSSVGGASPIG
jgi:hypothetical protein